MADEDRGAALSEDGLIARYFRPLAESFPGAFGLKDDAAVIEPAPGEDLVVTTDALIAGVHFLPDDDPADIAYKALAVNVSDLAAKAAKPIAYSLALVLPRNVTESWIATFADGLRQAQAAFGIALSGGDTTTSPTGPLMISVAAFGGVPRGRTPRRAGAKPGDSLYVSGTIGDAALGLRLRRNDIEVRAWPIDSASRQGLIARFLRPEPRLALRDALLAHASAAMDISDGLAIDCARLCSASGVSVRIEAANVPLSPAAAQILAAEPALLETILTGGDDYEILAAIPPDHEKPFAEAARVAVTRIGMIGSEAAPLSIIGADGQPLALSRLGYDHLAR